MPTAGEQAQQHGRDHLAHGRLAAAIAAYRQAIELDPGLGHAWHELGVTLGLAAAIDDLCRLTDRAAPLFESTVVFFQNVALDLMNRQAFAALEPLADLVPADRPYYPVAVYYAGTSRIARRDYLGSLAFHDRFKALVSPRHENYPLTTNVNFNLIYRQATLVDSPATVARLAATTPKPETINKPTVIWQRPWCEPTQSEKKTENQTEPPLFASALNNLYFLRFAEELAASFARHRPGDCLHFHIIESDPACVALAQRLRERHPAVCFNFSAERRAPYANGVYYTCDRFLILPQLFKRYRVPRIITLDADSVLNNDLSAVLSVLDGYDFACFNTGRTEPASVYQATFMMFADTPAGRRFIDLLRRFVLAKIDQPPVLTWMLDQAALFSVICYLQASGADFRLGEIDRLTGLDLRYVIGGLGSDQEKLAMMAKARG